LGWANLRPDTRHVATRVQPTVKNLINGEFVESKTTKWIPLADPVRRQPRG